MLNLSLQIQIYYVLLRLRGIKRYKKERRGGIPLLLILIIDKINLMFNRLSYLDAGHNTR